MKVFIVLILFLSVLFCEEKKEKIFYGFRKDIEYLRGKGEYEIVEKLKDWGISGVFGGYRDDRFVKVLRDEGIKVFAKINVFVGEKYWKKKPESRPINSSGEHIEKIKWYCGVCPNQEWLRRQKLNEVRVILTKYSVDGIWLDFIRYPCYWEGSKPELEETCFCKICLDMFQRETRVKIPEELSSVSQKARWILEEKQDAWIDWKCSRITRFVRDVKKIIEEVKPGVKLGLFGVPWTEHDYDNAIKRIICQDYKQLSEYVDVFSPMVYHKLCGRKLNWIVEVTDYLHHLTNRPVLPIIQAFGVTKDELDKAISCVLNSKSAGVIIFDFRRFVLLH